MSEILSCPQCFIARPDQAPNCECGYSFSEKIEQPMLLNPDDSVRTNYIVQHWQGKHSVPRSYWVNTFLVNLPVVTAAAYFQETNGEWFTRSPKVVSFFVITMWVVIYLIGVWQCVGLARSASRELQLNLGPWAKLWRRLAQVFVLVFAYNSAQNLVNVAAPQVLEYTRILTGASEYSKYAVRILHEGSEIEIDGGIGFGLTDLVVAELTEHPGVRVIHLNSIGGFIVEARKLKDLVKARRLITYTSRGCQSACTIVFMAGSKRYLYRNAQLGFHRPAFPGVEDNQIAKFIAQDTAEWRASGVSQAFIDKAFSTPNSEMWKPSAEALLNAGVITSVTEGEEFAMSYSKFVDSDSERIEEIIAHVPFLATLRQYDPQEYAVISRELRKGFKGDASYNEIVAASSAMGTRLFARYGPRANDQALIMFATAFVQGLEYLQAKEPGSCYGFLFPERAAGVNVFQSLPKNLQDAMLTGMAQVVQSGASAADSEAKEESLELLSETVSKLTLKYGSENVKLLTNPERQNVDRDKVCVMTTAVYKEVLKLPRHKGGMVLRAMFSAE